MKLFYTLSALLLVLLFFSCQQKTTIDKENIEKKIMAVLNEQMRYWNDGDIEQYMAGYDRSDSLRFASGGKVSYGWENTLERYKNGYPNKETMGTLQFSNIDVSVISGDAALVFGKWELQKENEHPWGLFTLIFQQTNDGWRIVHDHTSTAQK
ncbi:MAG: nuclear transport factor 2 family protein [Gemmatimonadota bacterium]|nr:MAG: nuclear transport factor 2 family protein [Gemmatimonadota bacterium]